MKKTESNTSLKSQPSLVHSSTIISSMGSEAVKLYFVKNLTSKIFACQQNLTIIYRCMC
jgi:hypothetical protein